MKNLLLVFTFFVSVAIQGQQIPNGDFENWVQESYGEEPANWGEYGLQLYNSIFPGLLDSTIVKSLDAYSGNYAMEIRSKTLTSFGSTDTVIPYVMLNLKNAETDSAYMLIDSNLQSLSGYIKQDLASLDSNFTAINILLYYEGNLTGVGGLEFDSNITNYTFFDIPILNFGTPGDSIELFITAGNTSNPLPGNIMKLDGLSLNYMGNSIAGGPKTYVPDNNFEAYLENNGMGDGIANNDSVSTNNINSITTLNIDGSNISDLTGIEDFIALQGLDCSYNSLTTLDLSNNINLIYIEAYDNQISSFDATYNTSLQVLDLEDNLLTCLNLINGNNTILTELWTQGNSDLSCIQVDDSTYSNSNWLNNSDFYLDSNHYFSVNCSNCSSTAGGPKTYVPDNNFEAYLENNGMGDGIANNDSVSTNNINSITTLNIDGSNISDLTGIEDFIALQGLDCSYNSLTTLDLSNNINLIYIEAYDNQISSFDATYNTSLQVLDLEDNLLTCLNLINGNNTILTELWTQGNSDLSCIQVDDSTYSNSNWLNNSDFYLDPNHYFSVNCNYSSNCFDGPANIIENNSSQLSVFPNPTNNVINIKLDNYTGAINLQLYDLTGKLIKSASERTLDLEVCSKGIYLLKVAYGDRVHEVKVIKE